MPIYLLTFMCALNHSGFGGSRVLLSLYALELGANQFTIGTLMALYAVFPMLLAVYAGRLSDRVGARIPMLIGTGGVMIGLLIPLVVPGLLSLYVAALVMGSCFHFFFVSVQGIAGGIGGGEYRAKNFALISLGFSAAGFVGPLVAGLAIDHYGYLTTFAILASFLALPLLLLLFKPGFLPPPARSGTRAVHQSPLELWRIQGLRRTFIASGFISSAWDLFQFYLPVYGHSIGLSASVIGVILGVFAAATFTIRTALPALARRFSEVQILAYAIFVAAAAFTMFPFFVNPLLLAAAAFLLGLGVGCGQPMSMSLIYALSPPGRASESAGLRVTVNNVTHLVIPLFFGSLGTAFGYAPVFLSNAALLAAGGVLMKRTVIK
jgi:MFS family permease